jgi:hypothetical protein
MIEKEAIKYCSQCKTEIFCHIQDIEKCACSTIELTPETRKFLTKTYFDCLCNHCLETIHKKVAAANAHSFPTEKSEFIEGVHFYKEGNMWVFTELYHLLKGSCCGNGCRHCVYGYTE